MINVNECEKHVIEKLIAAFSKTLNCYSAGNNETEALLVEKVLHILLVQNESLHHNKTWNSTGEEIMDAVSEDQQFVGSGENSTSVMLVYDQEITVISSEVETTGDKVELTGTNKLHQLEIIKVFVLIFVISIILLTTCRMVFQLFIRFRPEKPPLA